MLLKIFLLDLKEGCKKNIYKYLIAIAFSAAVTLYFIRIAKGKCGEELAEVTGIYDIFVYVLGGVNPMKANNPHFELPLFWMSLRLLVCSCIFVYPIKDLYGRGVTVLLKFGSKTKWWLSKIFWSVLQVLMIYGIFFLTVIVTAHFNGIDEFTYTKEIGMRMSGAGIVDESYLMLKCIFFPILYATVMAIVEINLSLFIDPVLALLAVVSYDILASCIMKPIFLGNLSMVLRIKEMADRGVHMVPCSISLIVICFLSILAGITYLQKKDIIGK